MPRVANIPADRLQTACGCSQPERRLCSQRFSPQQCLPMAKSDPHLCPKPQKTTVVVEEANEDMALQVAELRTLSDGMRLDTAGVKGAFLVAASRIAAISDAACGKLPEWIKEKTSIGKVLDVENSATGERLEFDYLENGDIKSRTFRSDVLVCEILHDSNGGVREGIVYSPDGTPQKRFVYDAMGQVKEQEKMEG